LYEVSSGDEKGIDFLPKRVSSAVIFSIFGSGSHEEVHYCGKYFLRQWRYDGVFPEEV
jgi:hypothetical protein